MLVEFSVSNFRSFLEEQTFSLVASKRLTGSHEDHALPIPDSTERVLRVGVLYGANGAGKSNLYKALRFAEGVAIRTRNKSAGTGRTKFKFDAGGTTPSLFDIQIVAGGKLYRYGFKIDDESILEEWLVRVIGEREQPVFERATDATGNVKIDAADFKAKRDSKFGLLAAIGGPHNQSFLATARATLEAAELPEDVRNVVDWFVQVLRLTGPSETIEPVGHLLTSDAKFLDFAGEFLKLSSTGVDQLLVDKTEMTEEELGKFVPKSILSRVLDDLKSDKEGIGIVQMPDGNELIVEQTDANHFYRVGIQALHEDASGTMTPLALREESDGTRRLLQLLPALHTANSSKAVYFIDEIDRSMHPMLIWRFLEFFLRTCASGDGQIIVTTHESNLLDLELLRRDEIWFVEKNDALQTRLYPLTDFGVRKDLEIRKHYLQGRFGAVPFLGSLERLLDGKMAECQ